MSEYIVVKSRARCGYRIIPPSKWWPDRRVDIGEDAHLVEEMPHGGSRWIDRDKILFMGEVLSSEYTNGAS